MAPNELQLLACGLVLGAWIAVLVRLLFDQRAARRASAAAAVALKRAAGDHFANSLRLYNLQTKYGLIP